MKFTKTLLALAIASSAAIAPTAFAQSADLSVTGRIFPGACTIELGGGGVANLGSINTAALNADADTDLEPVAMSMAVQCESAVRIALQGTDNASDSAAYPGLYGLGMTSNDEKIGGAVISVQDVQADGVTGYGTSSTDGGASWDVAGNDAVNAIETTSLRGFAKDQGVATGPAPTAALSGTLVVSARIQPTDTLTITGDTPINGNATLNVIYL
ncbi:DUF1120 domain-containing protein [Stenotrophomonas rhizophila]|uniref:DUF1120 domain-containing protein n=1 Tax=Stenotrophomonas rhizophila TaxID=216778 RepID=UPI0011A2CCE7|nr:DUF1120 domain-containing protein [Stenotrophomonas rhizophila]